MSQTIYTGIVKWYNIDKGYGFINVDDEEGDLFVHRSSIIDEDQSLDTGDRVEFMIAEGRKGPQAAQVRKVISDP